MSEKREKRGRKIFEMFLEHTRKGMKSCDAITTIFDSKENQSGWLLSRRTIEDIIYDKKYSTSRNLRDTN